MLSLVTEVVPIDTSILFDRMLFFVGNGLQ